MLTQDEAELYDRQIRLWGVNAQSRIRQSRVLMLGFNGIASEVAKILVLAGIDTLTVVDDQPIQDSDIHSNLFCRPNLSSGEHITNEDESLKYRTHALKAKLKVLNPLVKVNIDNSSITSKTTEDFKGYDLVTLHSFLTIDETNAINDICRERKIKLYVALDYGFFGFIFNDLGPKFEFTYEEFNNVAKSEKDVQRPSGAERDPISLGDDAYDEGPDELDYGSSDDEIENRPKKKRRLQSPVREPVAKAGENEKLTKVGSLEYAPFADMISLTSTSFSKKTNPILFISIAMFKFYSEHKRLPVNEPDQIKEKDKSKLKEILAALKESSNLENDIFKNLDEEWHDYIYSSLSPVCAAIGGVAGQDMIRALSNKDIPIHNTFSFDGINMTGFVEKSGISQPKIPIPQTVVRDFLQIDD